MIGVILWSDEDERKAVIWCEDQGDLAFLDNTNPSGDQTAFFVVGDIVSFDLFVQANLRRAHNVRLLEEQTAAHQTWTKPSQDTTTAKIIPFRMAPKLADSEDKRNAHGA